MAQQDMGLFGPSAAEVQRALDDRARLSNLEQAKLDPYQSIRLSMANYGTAAGKAIGGLFGIEDPALKEATEMDAVKKAVASQWDGQDPEKALQLFADEANKRGLTQQALSATFKLQSMKADREKAELGKVKTSYEIGKIAAQTQEALRKAEQAKTAKVPSFVQLQDARDSINEALQTEQDPQKRTMLETRLNELNNVITKESTREPKYKTPPSVGTDREAIAQEIYDKGFYDLTPQEKAVVNKREAELAKGKQTTNVVLNTPQTAALVDQGQKATKPIFDRVQSIDRSITLIDQNTPFSEAALRQEISSIFGDSQKAATEVRGLANTGSLDERVANRFVNFVSGKDTKVTNEDRRAVLVALRKREQNQYERRLNPFRQAIKKESGGDANAIFPSFEEAFGQTPGVVSVQRKTKSGTTYTVEQPKE